MRNFILGVVATLLVLVLGGLATAMLGLLPTTADATPPRIERRIAMSAVDASMERRAPQLTNPVPPTDDNLIDGMKIYTMNCAGCHGGLDKKPNSFGQSFYPPVPQLILHPMDDPEWHIYYATRTGIRYTAHACLEQDFNGTGNVESDGLPFPHRKIATRRAGILEEVCWNRASGPGP